MTPAEKYEPYHTLLLNAVTHLADTPNAWEAQAVLLACSRAVLTEWETEFAKWLPLTLAKKAVQP